MQAIKAVKHSLKTGGLLYSFHKSGGGIPLHSLLSKERLTLKQLQTSFNKSGYKNGLVMSSVTG